tara:strand:+ start:90 stop:254 length:165 start_codon:yes stop_codon:yes gene_type:complete
MEKALVATRLDVQIHKALKSLAKEQDRTVSYLMRKACEQYVENQQKKAKKVEAA